MAQPFLGEVRMVGFNFAPRGWAFCDGQILPINQNQSLYSLLGTTYGGDGRTSFALPDLRGRSPIHTGSSNCTSHLLGQNGGAETVQLQIGEMPQHDHLMQATNADATAGTPSTSVVLAKVTETMYSAQSATPNTTLATDGILPAGGNQAHNNMQPFLAVYFCIALQGLFPSRN